MDRRHLAFLVACLTPLASPTLPTALHAAQPGGAFAWESQGPALPVAQQNGVTSRTPRYVEAYPSQPNQQASRAPATPPQTAPVVQELPVTPTTVQQQPAKPTSPGLAAAARHSQTHIQRGMDLGNRRAFYSARAEFVEALRVMAQSLDAEHRTDGHSQALAAGLKALDELDDFIARGNTFEAELNVARLAAVHRTPVVRSDPEGLTPREALERYYTYAQEQLASSMGEEPAGSAALTAMGKFYSVMGDEQPSQLATAQGKALALHQAALVVDMNNAVSANELGVLLARLGRPKDAKSWLEHSANLSSQAATWHNLAVVNQQLGETKQAEEARRQETAVAQRTGRSANSAVPEIRWVSPRELDSVRVDRPTAPAAAVPRAATPVPRAATPPPNNNQGPPLGMRTAAVPGETISRSPEMRAPGPGSFE